MKPDWDKLSEEYPAVYDVDCTAAGKDLCEEVGVKGYPTIKYGDASDMSALQDYSGGRDYESLKKFAEENLGPVCGPDSLDACEPKEKKLVEKLMQMPVAELEKTFKDLTKNLGNKKKQLKKRQTKLQDQFAEFYEDKGSHDEKKPPKGKEKLHATKTAAFNRRKEKLDKDQESLDEVEEDIKEEEELSGIKFMKAVIKKAKDKKPEL